jgi:hypothetical protein
VIRGFLGLEAGRARSSVVLLAVRLRGAAAGSVEVAVTTVSGERRVLSIAFEGVFGVDFLVCILTSILAEERTIFEKNVLFGPSTKVLDDSK